MKSARIFLVLPAAAVVALAGQTVVFEDRFDTQLAAGWRWV